MGANEKPTAVPRHDVPELCMYFAPEGAALPQEGSGESRVPDAPAAARVELVARALVTTVAPDHPAFPHAMVLRLIPCSPW